MIDIFCKEDACKLLQQKTIVFMGDSNIRAIYKDFLCLMKETKFIPNRILKQKMEDSCFDDKLVFHGPKCNGRDYREEREAIIQNTVLQYYFLTRVYDDYVEGVLKHLACVKPDIIVINSCLWDVTRWGFTGVEKYKDNLKLLMKHLKRILPDCLVIWITTPPISCDVKGGFLVKELQFLKYSLRFHVVEANHYARKVVVDNGFDVLDSHYHLKMQIHRRSEDGIHWLPEAVRYISNLLCTHISLAWNVPLPHRYNSLVMDNNLQSVIEDYSDVKPPVKIERKDENLQSVFEDYSFTKQPIKIEKMDENLESVMKDYSVTTKPAVKMEKKPVPPAITSRTRTEMFGPKQVDIKNDKENCNTPKRKKPRSARKAKRANQKTSHHAFLNREQQAARHKRIRQWHRAPIPSGQRNVILSSPYASPASHYNSPIQHIKSSYHYNNSPHHTPVIYDQRQDSGYFPSPNQFESVNNSQASSPYMPQTRIGRGGRQPWRTVVPDPYIFPQVIPGQTLQPHIDFTSEEGIGGFF